jgi:hypothetical protein
VSPNDPKRRVECYGIPLKPKAGLNGAPSLRCRWNKLVILLATRAASRRLGMTNWRAVAHLGMGEGDGQNRSVAALRPVLVDMYPRR